MTLKKWLCVAIGCTECGEKSWVVGFFNTKEEAKDAERKLDDQSAEFHHALIEEVEIPEK